MDLWTANGAGGYPMGAPQSAYLTTGSTMKEYTMNTNCCHACGSQISKNDEFCNDCQKVIDEINNTAQRIDNIMDNLPILYYPSRQIVYYFIKYVACIDVNVSEWSHITYSHYRKFCWYMRTVKLPIDVINYCIITLKEVYLMMPGPKQNFTSKCGIEKA